MADYLSKYRAIVSDRKSQADDEVTGAESVLTMLRERLAKTEAQCEAELTRARNRVAWAESALEAARAKRADMQSELADVQAEVKRAQK